MKALSLSIFAMSSMIMLPAASIAKPPSDSPRAHVGNNLAAALQKMVQPRADPLAQTTTRAANSQGALHASPRAIEVVCNHDNPSAERSAICRPVSPE